MDLEKILEAVLKVISPTLTFFPRWAQGLFASTFALILVSAFVGVLWWSSAQKAKEGMIEDTALPELIKRVRASNPAWKYVIESATMIVHLEQDSANRRIADVKMIYTIFALND